MFKKNFIKLFVIAILLLSSGKAYSMPPAAYQYYLSSNYYLSIKQYDKAISDLQKAISIAPMESMLYVKLAGVYNDSGDWKSAVENYKKASTVKPDDAFIYVSLGNILQQHDDYKGALKAYEQAYKINPSYKYNLNNIASVSLQLKKYDEAEKYYKEFLAVYPNHFDAMNNLASIYMEKGNYTDAVEIYKRCYAQNPKMFQSYYLFSYALMKKGDYKNAIEGFKQEINLHPDNPSAYLYMAVSYSKVTPKNAKSAITCYERAFTLSDEFSEYRLDYAKLLLDNNRIADSITQYQKYISEFPAKPGGYYGLGIAYLKQKKYPESIQNLQKVLEIDSKYYDTKTQLAFAYQSQGKYADANGLYLSLINTETKNVDLLYNAALSLEHTKNYTQAISYLEKAVSLSDKENIKKELANAYTNYGAYLLDKGSYSKAATEYEKALKIDANKQAALSGLAFCANKTGNYQKSVSLYEKSVSVNSPQNTDFVAYGNSLLALKKTDEAIGAFKKAIEIDSNKASAHEGLADAYMQNQYYDKAVREYELAAKLNPNSVNINIKLGNIYKENLENQKALNCYNLALQSDSRNLLALHNKAATLFDMNKIADAKSVYKTMIGIDSDFAMAYYGLGVIAEKEQKYTEAIGNYNKFVNLTDNVSLKKTIQRRIELLKLRI